MDPSFPRPGGPWWLPPLQAKNSLIRTLSVTLILIRQTNEDVPGQAFLECVGRRNI